MFKKLVSKIVGDPNQKIIQNLDPLVEEIGAFESELQQLGNEQLRERSLALRQQIEDGASLDELMAEAFALVREASVRTIGLRHYDVQLMGGALLHRGEVVEMRTGEGKTLVATLPLYLNALTGQGVHLVTVNEYLARRDGGWMGNIFHLLGLTTACIGPQQFSALFDPDFVNPGAELEDERLVHWRPCTRREAYEADITYGISSEFGFDYLRDNMATSVKNLVQRDLNYAIIDEVDNVLIDEARTPLIISGPAPQTGKEYSRFAGYVRGLRENTAGEEEEPNGHYDIDEKSRSISLTDLGIAEIEKRIDEINVDAGDSLYDPRYYHLTYYLDNALRAQYLFKKDVQYVVQDGQVVIVDDFTGRLMPGRRYSDGLHEAIEAKEGVDIKRETTTVATITLQNYFRLYDKLAGMTGTALTDAEEFDEIYSLGVTPLPTNVEYIVNSGELGLITDQNKVENSDAVRYLNPETKDPVFFKRIDFKDQIYATAEAKDQAIITEIKRIHQTNRPVLVGTTSVEHSERIHRMLNRDKIPNAVLNAKIHQSEALVVAQAGQRGAVTISTNMAGRGTDILLGGNPEGLAADMVSNKMFDQRQFIQLAQVLLADGPQKAREFAAKNNKLSEDLVDWIEQENSVIQEALPQVEELGIVRYVTREFYETYGLDYNVAEQIVSRLQVGDYNGAREQLTELGSDITFADEANHELELLRNYSVVLNQRQTSPQQKAQALGEVLGQMLFEEHYNARAALIRAVLGGDNQSAHKIVQQTPGMPSDLIAQIDEIKADTERARREIWKAGGLHVVGSERHESRRIDNQLRGRAARQGDPGSSRFFLSLEDDLMRRFGGERLKSFMSRTNIPDDMPIENSMLDRIIESSQERIEGYNFDIRKNVVEYDDVMSKQRQAIYNDRRKILMGEEMDLDERISEAFDVAINDLVNNYVIDYPGYMRGEIDRVISEFSTEATDTINLTGIIRYFRGLLPGIVSLDREELENLSAEQLADRLMILVYENEERGENLYQLLQAMGRFLPILPTIPNLTGLAKLRSGQLPARDRLKKDYIVLVDALYNEFLAQQVPDNEREAIWQKAQSEIEAAFDDFRTDNLTAMTVGTRQSSFRRRIEKALRDLLLESLSTLDGEQLIAALGGYVTSQQEAWKKRIGTAEYNNFQRQLLLSAIDNEWRDYLTAMDDLRREIGLAALGQRDPKVEYKKRSFAMFTNMRENIQKDVADRFFRQVANHMAFVERQQAAVNYKLQAQSAGYRVVSHGSGKGTGVERVTAKVGRNDPCPCGSGKKYKQCHGRLDKSAKSAGKGAPRQGSQKAAQKKKSKQRRR